MVPTRAAARRSLRCHRGQTTTEYLMIMGLITSVFMALNNIAYQPFHLMMQNLLQCIADGTINQMACQSGGSGGGVGVASPGGGLGGLLQNVTGMLGGLLNGLQPTPVPSTNSGGGTGNTTSSGTVPTHGSDVAVSGVRVTSTTETFTGPDGQTHQTTRICTADMAPLRTYEQSTGAVFTIIDIQSQERPQVGAGLRVPVWEVAPGQWRAQIQMTRDELETTQSDYCLALTDRQGPQTTVTNVRFTTTPER